MWTFNSAKKLPATLKSIEKAIPNDNVNQKIMVDAHSTDETKTVGEKFGWNVIDAETVGIPYQANQALNMVETEFFASFEHDVIVHPSWFKVTLRHLRSDSKAAVVQGVRLTTNPILKAIEEVSLATDARYVSIDNNLYRTELIRRLGGFNINLPLSADRDLQDRVRAAGYKWIVDKTVISQHIRGTVRQTVQRAYNNSKFVDYPGNPSFSQMLSLFFFSPLRGFDIALKKQCPLAAIVYPYYRLVRLRITLQSIPKQKQITLRFQKHLSQVKSVVERTQIKKSVVG